MLAIGLKTSTAAQMDAVTGRCRHSELSRMTELMFAMRRLTPKMEPRWTAAYLPCFNALLLVAVAHNLRALRKACFIRAVLIFFAIALGFVLQSGFLSLRGHALGRCPTRFVRSLYLPSWSVAHYLVIVPPIACRSWELSRLPGFLIQVRVSCALDVPHQSGSPRIRGSNSTSMSMIAYGAFALPVWRCHVLVAGTSTEDPSADRFFSSPPLTNLFAAITRCLARLRALPAVLVSGFLTAGPLPRVR